MRIVLASASPRRRELLEQIGLKFEVAVSNVQEQTSASEPWRVVEELSEQKAEAVLKALGEVQDHAQDSAQDSAQGSAQDSAQDSAQNSAADYARNGDRSRDGEEVLVVGADTVVAADGSILGKPKNREEAAQMLAMLSGRSHEVYTGVTLLYRTPSGQICRKIFHERTEVTFYPMSEAEIDCYVSTGDCMDKAGAYGIQGFCARYIKEIRGDYNNVVGLPVGRLYQEMKNLCGKNF